MPVDDLIGEEGKGFDYCCTGSIRSGFCSRPRPSASAAPHWRGRAYAKERVVFGRPIGQNQAIQHPLAQVLDGARGRQPDGVQGRLRSTTRRVDCGAEANAAKYLGAEAGFKACETAVMAHGGMGYAKEYHVERYFREAMIAAHRAGLAAK